MIKTITVINENSQRLTLTLSNPGDSGYIVRSIKGLGAGKADINLYNTANSDGGLFNSSRVNQRNIVFSLLFYPVEESVEELRLKIYRMFPIKRRCKFIFETENRVSEIFGFIESNEPDIFSEQSGTDISVVCPDPFFYSTGANGLHTTIFSGIEPMFTFPFRNNVGMKSIIFGEHRKRPEVNIFYDGDVPVGVDIDLHFTDQTNNIKIYNLSNHQFMHIDTSKLSRIIGNSIQKGDDIHIKTSRRSKSIQLLRNGKHTNILNSLGQNSEWITLSKGDNIFTYTADKDDRDNVQVRITHKDIYWGI